MTVQDATMIEPWAPYREDVFPRSSGRVSLGEALATYLVLMHGMSADDIAAAFDGRDDCSADRERVISATRLLGMLLLQGRLCAWARPIGGGEPVELEPHHWELDDFLPRFATCALDMRRPFDASSPPTHRIFIGEDDHRAIFEACCDDVPRPIVKRHASSAQPAPQADLLPPQPRASPVLDPHLRMERLIELTGMAKQTIYKRIAQGRFPAQIDPGSRPARWYESEVAAWLADPR